MAKTRFRCKESRALSRAVHSAGGTITRTASGHLRVMGPGGHAVICSAFGSRRSVANAVSAIRLYAGLDLQI